MPSRKKPKKLTIEQVVSFAENEFADPSEELPRAAERVESPNEEFDDALHRLVNSTRRILPEEGAGKLCKLLRRLFGLCDEDESKGGADRWKLVVLALVHKRYHSKSPEAKAKAKSEAEEGAGASAGAAGQGERLAFYCAVACLLRYAIQRQRSASAASASAPLTAAAADRAERSARALGCLCRIAPRAGGTRDVSALIEVGVRSALSDVVAGRGGRLAAAESSRSAVVARALGEAAARLEGGGPHSFLGEMLGVAADYLDRDLEIIAGAGVGATAGEEAEKAKELPSTFHVFVPHHGRGESKGTMSDRNLVQSVAEILIWARTSAAMSNGAFSSEGGGGGDSPSAGTESETPRDCLHSIQTIIRNLRKGLNSYSRGQGFMLSDQFQMDSSAIAPAMVGRGKAGDLAKVTTMARKKGAARVLKMINLRYARDPSRVSTVDSIGELIRCWVPLPLGKAGGEGRGQPDDELVRLELGIQKAKVQATIKKLRSLRTKNDERKAVVATLDNSVPNSVASVLMAGAMSDWELENQATEDREPPSASAAGGASGGRAQLYLRDVLTDMSSLEDMLEVLNRLIVGVDEPLATAPSYVTNDGVATTKAVLNVIDRHLCDGGVLLLFTSADLRLPDDVMKSLAGRGCAVHCHDAEDFGTRLDREGAQSGDITVSLVWDTVDDLDLHVIMPSGEEINYSHEVSSDRLGKLDVDMNGGGPHSKEPVENVFFGDADKLVQAPKGKYRVFVQNYAYHSEGARNGAVPLIPWRVLVDMNGEKKQYSGACKGTGTSSNVTVCEFEYNGRTIPFPQEMKETSAFGSSNLVNLMASTGQTIDSLAQ